MGGEGGGRIRLRETWRRVYTANSSLQPLEIGQGISPNRPGLEERSFLFSSSFVRNGYCQKERSRSSGATYSSSKRVADWTWNVQFMFLLDIHIKKLLTPTEKVVPQKAGWGLKRWHLILRQMIANRSNIQIKWFHKWFHAFKFFSEICP